MGTKECSTALDNVNNVRYITATDKHTRLRYLRRATGNGARDRSSQTQEPACVMPCRGCIRPDTLWNGVRRLRLHSTQSGVTRSLALQSAPDFGGRSATFVLTFARPHNYNRDA